MMVMMAEQAITVLKEVPNNEDVQRKNDQDRYRRAAPLRVRPQMQQFVNLNRDEEGRFADGQPNGPAHAKHQSYAFDERKQAVHQSAGSSPQNVCLRQLADLSGEIGPEHSLPARP